MKKFTKVMLSAAVIAGAVLMASCSNSAAEMECTDVSEASRSNYYFNSYRLYSDLNPGYGKAVYFAGNWYGSGYWRSATRGNYDAETGKWYLDVNQVPQYITPEFYYRVDYKCLTGDWDLAKAENNFVVSKVFDGLTKVSNYAEAENTADGNAVCVYSAENVPYGKALFFYSTSDDIFADSTAVRGEYRESIETADGTENNVWVIELSHANQGCEVYIGDWSLGEKLTEHFENLTWENSDNHVIEQSGNR